MFDDLLKVSSKILVCSMLELFNCVILTSHMLSVCLAQDSRSRAVVYLLKTGST